MSILPRIPATTRRNLVLLLPALLITVLLLRAAYDPTIPQWLSSTSVHSKPDLEFEEIDLEPYIPEVSEVGKLPNGIRDFNEPQLAKLDAALARGLKCGQTAETQLVMAGLSWALAYTWGATGGETYW